MTVVLFSTIIIWVTNIPVPTAQSRLDMESTMNPVGVGFPFGVNITVRHLGGDRLQPGRTRVYVTSQPGTNPPVTNTVFLQPYNGARATPGGAVDGSAIASDAGDRAAPTYYSIDVKDT